MKKILIVGASACGLFAANKIKERGITIILNNEKIFSANSPKIEKIIIEPRPQIKDFPKLNPDGTVKSKRSERRKNNARLIKP